MRISIAWRKKFTALVRRLARIFGRKLNTTAGHWLDSAFLMTWRGHLNFFGVSSKNRIRPVGIAQPRLRYWHQQLSWEEALVPDFKRLRVDFCESVNPQICHALITHLDAAQTRLMVQAWRASDPDALILVVHGGKQSDFDELPEDMHKIYVDDPALRTKDHAKEKQEYRAVWVHVICWLKNYPTVTHVHVVEYDVVPLVAGIGMKLLGVMKAENADLIGAMVYDLSGTIHPHYLNYLADEKVVSYVRDKSLREDPLRVLTMLGCTSFWSRNCLEDVSHLTPPGRIYLELAASTLAHHLGWRVRPLPLEQQKHIFFEGDYSARSGDFHQQGAWMVHPCKTEWKL